MNKILPVLLLFAVPPAHAETIVATVNGMVCAFCASGIEKSFKSQAAISGVKVDLEHHKVTLQTKPEATLADDAVIKIIVNAGYAVVGIDRQPQ